GHVAPDANAAGGGDGCVVNAPIDVNVSQRFHDHMVRNIAVNDHIAGKNDVARFQVDVTRNDIGSGNVERFDPVPRNARPAGFLGDDPSVGQQLDTVLGRDEDVLRRGGQHDIAVDVIPGDAVG